MSLEVTTLTPLIQVFDMPTSIRFYRDLLGFQLINTSPPLGPPDDFHWVMLQRETSVLMLNTAYDTGQRPPHPDPARVAAHHDTILYLASPNVEAAYTALRPHIPSLKPPKLAPYGMKQLYFQDPDGYALCYQQPA